jgi:predicted transcriptional regulator
MAGSHSELFELFSAPRTLAILHATDEAPQSVDQLAETCGASEPTIYRQVNEMADRDLLTEGTEVGEDGHHYTVYRNNVERVDVRLEPPDDGVHVELTYKRAADQFKRLWEDMSHEH